MTRSSFALALLATLGLAACGGGGGGSDSDRITKAIQNTAGISDPSLCDSLFTDQGIQQVYSEDSAAAGHKDCVTATKSKHDVKPSDVNVSAIKVSGDSATAVGAVKQGKGYFRLKKVGGDWKIDGVSETPGGGTSSTQTTASVPTPTTPTQTDPEAIKAEGSVLAWARAGRNGNKLAFCGLESDGLLKRQTGQSAGAGIAACVKAFRPISSFPKPESIRFTNVVVTGNRAELSIKAPGNGNNTTLSLVKVGALWKIDNAH